MKISLVGIIPEPGMERKEVNTVRLTERGMIYARERSHDLEY